MSTIKILVIIEETRYEPLAAYSRAEGAIDMGLDSYDFSAENYTIELLEENHE